MKTVIKPEILKIKKEIEIDEKIRIKKAKYNKAYRKKNKEKIREYERKYKQRTSLGGKCAGSDVKMDNT